MRRGKFLLAAVAVLAIVFSPVMAVYAATDVVDEIHYSYGESAGSVVFNWRGNEQIIYYGLTTAYGSQATAGNSAVTPVDIAGPFREVILTGLQPNTTYHYKIGIDGVDHTFKTMPTGNFKWVDMGDTSSTSCSPWIAGTHALTNAEAPDFVTHGGDISYANECGVASVHQAYTDFEAWSQAAAFQPTWGNHEYGQPTDEAPAGTPADTLANYKGRSYVTNAQIIPNDTPTKLTHPGCGQEIGSTTNTCLGEDWGWFSTGKVLFIAYPEAEFNALPDWQTKADALMAQAQADANIDFIVTYGHRPAYTSLSSQVSSVVRTAVTTLAQKYSPTTTNPTGKYVLNVAHHVHGGEFFAPIDGLTHVTNGGGGVEQTSYNTPLAANSIFTTRHPEILSTSYDASGRTLTVNMLCGPEYTPNPTKDPCTYGSTLYSKTFTATNTPTPPTGTPDSIYSYTLTGDAATVANGAATNPNANLALTGNWSQSAFGVRFEGDLISKQSGGSYKPTTGNTINAGATDAVGVAVSFRYKAPASSGCFADSQNLTQIGRFGANLGQVKIQFSNCGASATNVYPECRMAGTASSTSVTPVRSSAALVDGNSYIVKCYKTPDPTTGNATLTLRVVKIDTVNGNTVTANTFSIAPTGAITSNAYLSVANKFALPAVTANTDQFVGDMSKVSYCQATSTTNVETCLNTEIAEPAQVQPVVATTLSPNPSSLQVGQQTTYSATVTNTQGGSVANGSAVSVTLPSQMSIINANGGSVTGNTVSWTLGDIAGSSSVSKQVVAQLNSGTAGTSLSATASTTTTDTACSNTGSTCTASADITVAPSIIELIGNTGIETDLSGWSGKYGTATLSSTTRDTTVAHTGTASLKLTALTGASNVALGFNDNPRWVISTAAGKTYSQSVWVKPTYVGQKLSMRLREWQGSTLVTDQQVTLTAATTNWQQLSQTLTAGGSGNQLSFAVYSNSMSSGQYFYADDFSLTSN